MVQSIEVDAVPQPPKQVVGRTAATSRDGVGPNSHGGWLSELDTQHRNLADVFVELIDRIDQVPESPDRVKSHSELLRLIADTGILLETHFAFEEADGYLSDALAAAPRLTNRAALLRRDHRRFAELFAKLATSAREMRQGDQGWEYLGVAARKFVQELRVHELEENRLIQEAFLDDLGGGS